MKIDYAPLLLKPSGFTGGPCIIRIQTDVYLRDIALSTLSQRCQIHYICIWQVLYFFCTPKQCKKSVYAFTLILALIFVTGFFTEIICKFSYITIKSTTE